MTRLSDLGRLEIEGNLSKNQVVWYNNIDFTRSLNAKDEVKPEEFFIGSISVGSYYITVTLVSVVDPKKKEYVWVRYDDISTSFSKTRDESIIAFNSKIDRCIAGLDKSLEEYKRRLENIFFRYPLKSLPLAVKHIPLSDIKATKSNIRFSRVIYGFSYESLYRKGTVPWYVSATDRVCYSDYAINVSGEWYDAGNWIGTDNYGTNVMTTFYPSAQDLYLDYCRDKEIIIERYSNIMKEAIKKIEKKRVM